MARRNPAERIFRRYFKGEPWVRGGDPVSSISPALTLAVLERGL
jgi:hypothetical protein